MPRRHPVSWVTYPGSVQSRRRVFLLELLHFTGVGIEL